MHPPELVAVPVGPGHDVVLAAAAAVRARPSPSPTQLPVSTARGSATTLGVTTSEVQDENDRPSSTRPNESAIRISSGPISNLPRTSERSG
jgi:hypothetical protein